MIEITQHDLQRLVSHLNTSADSLVKFYTRAELPDDDSDDWISFSYGRRKMGLRKKRNGDCIFLSEKRRCTAYEARPVSCRIFPVDVILNEDYKVIDLELSDVVQKKFVKCEFYYGEPVPFRKFQRTARQARTETESYCKKIAEWNDFPEKGKKHDFLNFLGFDPTE
jgi:Fe-S-cluster containining protein